MWIIYIYYWRTLTSPVIMSWIFPSAGLLEQPVLRVWNLQPYHQGRWRTGNFWSRVESCAKEAMMNRQKTWHMNNYWFSYDVLYVLWESLNSKLSKPSPKVITIFYGVSTIPTFSSTVVMAVSARWGLCRESSQRQVGLQQRELMSLTDPSSPTLP